MMKRQGLLLAVVLPLAVVCAATLTDWPGEAPEAFGQCHVYKQADVAVAKDGRALNGMTSYVHISTPKINGSFAVALQVTVSKLPEKGRAAFAVRRGFNHFLGCDAQGYV